MNVFRRVGFDTSTLVGAALRVGSMPHRALAYALAAGELCASASTLAELDKVLLRSKFTRYQTSDARKEFAAIVRRHASVFLVTDSDLVNVHPPCRDPMDNQFLALAKACDAQALVSSDADLLVLHPWNGVAILTPSVFVGLVET